MPKLLVKATLCRQAGKKELELTVTCSSCLHLLLEVCKWVWIPTGQILIIIYSIKYVSCYWVYILYKIYHNIGTQGMNEENVYDLWMEILFVVVAFISSVISLLIPILYFIRKKCQEHPTPLIAIISIFEALSNYNVILIAVNIYSFEEFVDIQKIFNLFVFYERDIPDENSFCEFNFIIYIILEMLSIAYNVCFSLDLLLTLKWPFFAGKKRMKFYHFFSILLGLTLTPLSIIEAEEICSNEYSISIYKIPLVFFIGLIGFYLISFMIIVYSYTTPQNSQIRRKYISHHRIILITLVVVWAFPISSNALILLKYDPKSTVVYVLNTCTFFSLLISGGLINIVRFINDKFLWLQVKKMVMEWKYFEQSQPVTDDEEQIIGTSFIAISKNYRAQEHDIWNLPLANAVSSFHSQSVVTNIIQIIVETCEQNQQQIFISNFAKSSLLQGEKQQRTISEQTKVQHSEIKFENFNYDFNGPALSPKQIREYLKFGTYEQFRRITKINKKFDMISIEMKNGGGADDFQKNVFKSVQCYESYTSRANSFSSKRGVKGKQDPTALEVKTIKIKVKSYAHPVFTALRRADKLTAERIKKTLDLNLNEQNIKKARQSLGASGSFFFFSHDNKLVIKTIAESETNVFLKILPSYYDHIVRNPNSLLCRTYGLFSVEIDGISKINFIMLQNTFEHFENNKVTYRKYDLKGSTIKREVKNPNAEVLKDINFLNSDDAFLLLPSSVKRDLFHQIKADITLLSNHNIMDYSLLIGVHSISPSKTEIMRRLSSLKTSQKQQEEDKLRWRYFIDSEVLPTNKIYSISIIDYLQEFNYNKYAELTLKRMFKGGGDISSIDTEAYFTRFLSFVNKILVPVS